MAYGTSAREDNTQILSWRDAASRINELLDRGEFATNVELLEAQDYERDRISESLWYLTHDLSEEGIEQGYFNSRDPGSVRSDALSATRGTRPPDLARRRKMPHDLPAEGVVARKGT